jgi:transcriptional regulator with XRE-family HTH domain
MTMDQPRPGRPPKPLDPEASHAARLGAEIRARRLAQGLTQKGLADLIGFTFQHISEVELAKTAVSKPFVVACDRVLEAHGNLLELFPLAAYERAMQRHDRSVARHEATHDASAGETQAPARVLVAERYAGLQKPSEAEEDVEPVDRRSLLGAGVGAALSVAGAAAPAAAREIDPGLVEHWMKLLRLLDRHTAMFGPHEVLETVRREVGLIARHRQIARGEVRTALLRAEARWSEFASWLSNDTADARGCEAWAVRCLRLGKEAGDHDIVAWLLMWQSELACERSDAPRAVAFAQAGRRTPGISDRIRALCAEQEAYGHALAGDGVDCQRSLDYAHGLLRESTASPWDDLGGLQATPYYLLIGEARCWLWLRPSKAVEVFEEALRQWPDDRPRSRGVQQARLALACAAANEPDRAASEGMKALGIAQTMKSDVTVRELKRLDRELAGFDVPAVEEFREALAG